ncbi:flagellar protein FliT [Dyella sp. BiH032]|uniref:flagellar protein FliT n=1 Tax=Dyella sp. BiH032 TaxID=3075430 RepID=UPI00289346D6|nr:flagellar protein FliT [Dyella sp. BiH032]WNL47256.1 flagellar protein FliT [Dyella sp. BiH032]
MNLRLEQAVGLSRAMLAAAGEGDWEALARLQDERERLLELAPPAGPGDEAVLGTLIDCNRQLCEVVARERDKAAQEWQAAQGRSHAIAAYLRG